MTGLEQRGGTEYTVIANISCPGLDNFLQDRKERDYLSKVDRRKGRSVRSMVTEAHT